MYLLDTHAIIWYVSGNTELSQTAKDIMETKRCFFSFASLWEIAIKQAKGTLQFNIDIPKLKKLYLKMKNLFIYLQLNLIRKQ